jgi:hypothetical protein
MREETVQEAQLWKPQACGRSSVVILVPLHPAYFDFDVVRTSRAAEKVFVPG